jgi:anti-sigma regulatory factor (Ser/Thr protein kinase)
MLAEIMSAETRSFTVTPSRMSGIDDWIADVGSRWSVAEDVVFRARVCVAEVAANILEHGRARPDGDDIAVTLRKAGLALDVDISDTGRAFDPTAPLDTTTTRDTTTVGGRGLRLLHAYATDMTYRRDGARNILSLRVVPSRRGQPQ